MKWILAAFLTLGCGGRTEEPGTAPSQDAGSPDLPSIWFDSSSPFYAAQQAWGLPAPSEPELVVEYANLVQRDCHVNTGYTALGCLTQDGRIIIQPLNAPTTRAVLLHEVGHLLVGPGHIDSNGPVDGCALGDGYKSSFVMCTYGSLSDELTPRDRSWANLVSDGL